jgi:DNA-binding transcriptional regulator LsrR (DeoR family)
MSLSGGADDRIDQVLSERNLKVRERTELLSKVCQLFCHGKTANEIAQTLRADPKYGSSFKREHAWRLVRYAAQRGWLRFTAPLEDELADVLSQRYKWQRNRVTIVSSAVLDHVADRAAERLLELVRDYREMRQQEEIHIGFAGGRTLRKVAQKFAELLQRPAANNPQRIVIHAMVAAFNEDDFEADPNNFVSYFEQDVTAVQIALIRMPAPGIVETKLWKSLREFEAIRQVYSDAAKIHIVVSSGGTWEDEHSTLATYMREVERKDVDQLKQLGVIGDLLWQPLSKEGPIEILPDRFQFRANTLMQLRELPEFIGRGGRVLLVLGACGKCEQPKGDLLDVILHADPALVTDIVTDSPTVNDLLKTRRQASRRPR